MFYLYKSHWAVWKSPFLPTDRVLSMSVGEYLLDGTLGLEEDASAKQLGKDAAHRPDVDGVGIVPAPHQDLWRSIVLRHHLLGHVTRRIWLLHSCQAKVTNLNEKEKWHFSFCHYYLTEYIWAHVQCGTLSRQLLLTSRFPGLMSLCRMPAECRYFSPERKREDTS